MDWLARRQRGRLRGRPIFSAICLVADRIGKIDGQPARPTALRAAGETHDGSCLAHVDMHQICKSRHRDRKERQASVRKPTPEPKSLGLKCANPARDCQKHGPAKRFNRIGPMGIEFSKRQTNPNESVSQPNRPRSPMVSPAVAGGTRSRGHSRAGRAQQVPLAKQ